MATFKTGDRVRPRGNVSHAGKEGTIETEGPGYTNADGENVEQYWVKFPNADLGLYDANSLINLNLYDADNPILLNGVTLE